VISISRETLISRLKAAEQLTVCYKTVLNWCRRGRYSKYIGRYYLETVRVGGRLLTSMEAVDRFLDKLAEADAKRDIARADAEKPKLD